MTANAISNKISSGVKLFNTEFNEKTKMTKLDKIIKEAEKEYKSGKLKSYTDSWELIQDCLND